MKRLLQQSTIRRTILLSVCAMLTSSCILLLGVVRAYAEMEGFIVGGSYARIEQYPHSAFLTVKCAFMSGDIDSWICGSSIINQQILLSAAHCMHECSYQSHIDVTIGDEIRTRGITFDIHSFVVHEGYSSKTSANDLGLLKMSRSLRLNSKVSRVAIMKTPPYRETAIVAGWGMTDEKRGSLTNKLKVVTQNVWNNERCLQLFPFLSKGSICAANVDRNEYASQGDSGSALVVRGYIQIGLVSYKIPTVSRNVVVYTDVGYYYKWIRAYSKRLACV